MFFILLIAVMNLCLGFATAVYLQRFGGIPLPSGVPLVWPAGGSSAPPLDTPIEPESEPPATAAESSPEKTPLDEPDTSAAPSEEAPEDSEERDRVKCEEEVSIDEVMEGLASFRKQLGEIDRKLRDPADEQTPEHLQERVSELRQANMEYLQCSTDAVFRLQESENEDEVMDDVNRQVQRAIKEKTAVVTASNKELEAVDSESDVDEGRKMLLQQAGRMVEASCQLRDQLTNAEIEIHRKEGSLEMLGKEALTDPVTGIANREGFEAALEDFLAGDLERTRALSVATFDVDHCSNLNEVFGPQVGDGLISAVAQVAVTAMTDDVYLARFEGQRFIAMFTDESARSATTSIEQLRQVIEQTRFLHQGHLVEATVSCAVVVASEEDTRETLMQRVDDTLKEAKRYGRNRTFLHEGEYATPVIPPDLGVDASDYELVIDY